MISAGIRRYDTTLAAPGMDLVDVRTPATIVDLDRLERNLIDFPKVITDQGVNFRVHIKTNKVIEISRMAVDLGKAVGIACAKVSEAEVFAAEGFNDIVLAYPVFGQEQGERMAELARTTRSSLYFDSELTARGVSEAATNAGVTIGLQLELNTGFNRCGVWWEDWPEILRLAKLASSLPGIDFRGIVTHRQIFYPGVVSREGAGHDEGVLLSDFADRLRSEGVEVAEVVGGGTLNGRPFAEINGVTEVRAGTYVFNDLMGVSYGNCTRDQLALQIYATVNSRWAVDGGTIDAGSKTFAGDRAVVGGGSGVPLVDELSGIAEAADRNIWVDRLTEEHGLFRMGPGATAELGEKLRFNVYHCCTAANMTDEIVGVRGDVVEQVFTVAARGMRT